MSKVIVHGSNHCSTCETFAEFISLEYRIFFVFTLLGEVSRNYLSTSKEGQTSYIKYTKYYFFTNYIFLLILKTGSFQIFSKSEQKTSRTILVPTVGFEIYIKSKKLM